MTSVLNGLRRAAAAALLFGFASLGAARLCHGIGLDVKEVETAMNEQIMVTDHGMTDDEKLERASHAGHRQGNLPCRRQDLRPPSHQGTVPA